MSEVKNWVKDTLLNKQPTIDKIICIYPGRFQPFGKHHAETYKMLVNKFGKENVFIATSDKVDIPNSPFNFKEKLKIIKSFGISNVVHTEQPYKATEITDGFDPNTTAVVFALGKKDSQRLGGNYFKKWEGHAKLSLSTNGYVMIAPHVSLSIDGFGEMSGTAIRNAIGSTSDEHQLSTLCDSIFGNMDDDVKQMIVNRLTSIRETISKFCVAVDVANILNESNSISNLNGGEVDDGPAGFYANKSHYVKATKSQAKSIGYEVINYIINDNAFEVFNTDYPDGPVDAVSFFPAGVDGKKTSMNQIDNVGKTAFDKWKKHVTNVSAMVGYKFLDFLGADNSINTSKNESEGETNNLYEQVLTKDWWKGIIREVISNDVTHPTEGHMMHPFDNVNFTFVELKELVDLSLNGSLNFPTEKLDGQNIKITWKDGRVLAARNKGHIKNLAENAMDMNAISKKFEGRGPVRDAFVYAFEDLQSAFSEVDPEKLHAMFGEGKRFLNLEIIYPPNKNILPYPTAHLVFHGVNEYDISGNAIKGFRGYSRKLEMWINNVDANTQHTFMIESPVELTLNEVKDGNHLRIDIFSKLDEVINRFNLTEHNTIKDYLYKYWENVVNHRFPGKLTEDQRHGLINRFAFGDKSLRLNTLGASVELAKKIESKEMPQINKAAIFIIESAFLKLGAAVINSATGFMIDDVDAVIEQIKEQLKSIKESDDPVINSRLIGQQKKLRLMGGTDLITAAEGIVFEFKGNSYKLTGAFAPINQIIGAFRY